MNENSERDKRASDGEEQQETDRRMMGKSERDRRVKEKSKRRSGK